MRYVDLTLAVNEKIPPFPGDPKYEEKSLFKIEKHGVNEKRISLNSHFSTHIDAPYHMLAGGNKLDAFTIETFIGKALVIDVLGIKKIRNNHLPKKLEYPIILFHTGHTKNLLAKDFYANNPVITEEVAHNLVKHNVKIVGIDCGESHKFGKNR